MKLIKTLKRNETLSGHTLAIGSISWDELPNCIKEQETAEAYDRWYVVRNFDLGGVTFMYLCKGNPEAPNEICGFYRGGKFWASYGKNLAAAVKGMQEDGWLYA